MKNIFRFATLALTALLLGAVAYAQQPPPTELPLGDLVKQQKTTKKAKRVISNDDIPARAAEPETPAPDADAKPSAKPVELTPAQRQELQAKIIDLQESEAGERRIMKKMEDAIADPTTSENRRRMYSETLQKSTAVAEQYAKERESLEQLAIKAKAKEGATPVKQEAAGSSQ